MATIIPMMTAEQAQVSDELAVAMGRPTLDARLEELREQWEREPGDLATLMAGLHLSAHRSQPLPSWVAYGLQDVLIKQMAAQNDWRKDAKRWLVVQHLHFDFGLTLDQSFKGAAELLGGEPDTMRKSYFAYDANDPDLPPEKQKQRAGALPRLPGSPHPGFVEVDIGYCYARRTDLPWLLKRCPGLIEVGRHHGFVRLKSTTVDHPDDRFPKPGELLQLMRQCPGLVEVGCCDGIVTFKRA